MVNIIKRGGFREQAARQLKYKNSVNQRADISAQKVYPLAHQSHEITQDSVEQELPVQPDLTLEENLDNVSSNSPTENNATNKKT